MSNHYNELWSPEVSHIDYRGLIQAVAKSDINKVQVFLNNGADVNYSYYGKTSLLHEACLRQRAEMVKLLLKNGANISLQENGGYNALHFGSLLSNSNIVNMLLEYGANIAIKDNNDTTALHFAAIKGKPELINILIKNGAEINAIDCHGSTAMHVAASRGNFAGVKCLLTNGAVYNIYDYYGKTSTNVSTYRKITKFLKLVNRFFKAAKDGKLDGIVKLKTLIEDERSALMNARNKEGKSLIMVAGENNHWVFALQLQELEKIEEKLSNNETIFQKCKKIFKLGVKS